MASIIIHLAVAKELKEHLNISDERDYYLGAIAPDIAKQIGYDRNISHFIINSKDGIPNIDLFINRYPNFKYNSFSLGYFIHLYTDKLWFNGFIDKIVTNNPIKLLDGTSINATEEEISNMIYSDYTNLNIKVIEEYNIDLSLFYEDFKMPKTLITEIPTEKLDILIDKMGVMIENSKEKKAYAFDIRNIKKFIDNSVKEIPKILKKY